MTFPTPRRDNVIPFPNRFTPPQMPDEDDDSFDVNEYLTGGRRGFLLFHARASAVEHDIECGDLLFVDTTRRHEPGKLVFIQRGSRTMVGRCVAEDPNAVGVITHVLRARD